MKRMLLVSLLVMVAACEIDVPLGSPMRDAATDSDARPLIDADSAPAPDAAPVPDSF